MRERGIKSLGNSSALGCAHCLLLNNCKNQPAGFNYNSRPAVAGRDRVPQKDRTLEKGSIQIGGVSTRVITNIARQISTMNNLTSHLRFCGMQFFALAKGLRKKGIRSEGKP